MISCSPCAPRTRRSSANALERGEQALSPSGSTTAGAPARQPRMVRQAVDELVGANVAIVSVPGPYAALEAHEALAAGLDVLLFSDNVSVDEEIALKDHAARAGRLL